MGYLLPTYPRVPKEPASIQYEWKAGPIPQCQNAPWPRKSRHAHTADLTTNHRARSELTKYARDSPTQCLLCQAHRCPTPTLDDLQSESPRAYQRPMSRRLARSHRICGILPSKSVMSRSRPLEPVHLRMKHAARAWRADIRRTVGSPDLESRCHCTPLRTKRQYSGVVLLTKPPFLTGFR